MVGHEKSFSDLLSLKLKGNTSTKESVSIFLKITIWWDLSWVRHLVSTTQSKNTKNCSLCFSTLLNSSNVWCFFSFAKGEEGIKII